MITSAGPIVSPHTSKCQQEDHSSTPNFVRRRRYGPPVADQEQDSFAAYRHLAEVRMRRLERYKKAKSLCSLNHNDHSPAINSNLLSTHTSSTGHLGGEWQGGHKALRYTPPTPHFSASHSYLYSLPSSNMLVEDSICVDSESPGYCDPRLGAGDSYFGHVSSSSSSSQYSGSERESVALCKAAPAAASVQFEVLREKMISLMENDVQLLQKLLTLGETIQELRSGSGVLDSTYCRDTKHTLSQPSPASTHPVPKALNKACSSDSSLSSIEQEEHNNYGDDDSEDLESELKDEWRPLEASCSSSMSAITHLYVGGNEEDKREKQAPPKVQYFSRKNSVLRIPIPPRASNRYSAGKRITARGPAELSRPNRLTSSQPNDQEDSGHSSTSNSPSAQCSPTTVVSSGQELGTDSGQGNSSTDGGSSRFSTFSSLSSASTTSSCLHNNFIVSHVDGEKSNNLFLDHNQEYFDNKPVKKSCALKCNRSYVCGNKQENKLQFKYCNLSRSKEIN